MSTKIAVTYNEKEYVLEFSRQSVRQMEAQGFVASQVEDKPILYIYPTITTNVTVKLKDSSRISTSYPK